MGAVGREFLGIAAAASTAFLSAEQVWASLRRNAQALMTGTTVTAFGAVPPTAPATPGISPAGTGMSTLGVPLSIYGHPVFQHGGVMPYTGLAHLERGEVVTPAGQAPARAAPVVNIAVHLHSAVMGRLSHEDTRQVAAQLTPAIYHEAERMGLLRKSW